MYLFYDTETNGLPKDWNTSAKDVENWPRIVQLAWAQYDKLGNEISCRADIIKPDGFKLEPEATKVHGITDEVAENGCDLESVLWDFVNSVAKSKYVVAHNLRFDRKVIRSELFRSRNNDCCFDGSEEICTMLSSTAHCAIPGPRGNKWPKLEELHRHLFDEDFEGAHDALIDVRACARCFFELKRLGVIEA